MAVSCSVTSSLNTDWTSWPIAPSYPPFMHELLRMVVPSSVSRTSLVGEPLEEWLPPEAATARITVHTPDGRDETIAPIGEHDGAALRFAGTDQSGLYRVKVNGPRFDRLYAVNSPSRAESDLHRLSPAELLALTPDEDVQVVSKLDDVHRHPKRIGESPSVDEFAVPAAVRGPGLASILIKILFVLLFVESLLAWRFGAARAGSKLPAERSRHWVFRTLDQVAPVAVVLMIAGCLFAAAILLHAAWTNDFLGFLPSQMRGRLESALGVPSAATGEGTRWRLEFLPFVTGRPAADRWLVGVLAIGAALFAIGLYRREFGPLTNPLPNPPPPRGEGRVGVSTSLVALRLALFGLTLLVLLPQLRVLFEREGWPDMVILIDDSKSMDHVDEDPPKPSPARGRRGASRLGWRSFSRS